MLPQEEFTGNPAAGGGASEGWVVGGVIAIALIVIVIFWMDAEARKTGSERQKRLSKYLSAYALPAETWRPTDRLTSAELRARLERLGADPELERLEAIATIADRTDDVCAICQEPFREGERLRSLQECRHCYHAECIDKWISVETSKSRVPACPTCNTQMCKGCPSGCPLCKPLCAIHTWPERAGEQMSDAPPSRGKYGGMGFPYSLMPNVCVLAVVVVLHLTQEPA